MIEITEMKNQMQDMQHQLASANEDAQNQLGEIFSIRENVLNQLADTESRVIAINEMVEQVQQHEQTAQSAL